VIDALPIDRHLAQIAASLRVRPTLVLEAPPGAGKTTRVPPALLDETWLVGREVWVVEPRRMAAILAARRVASELAERPGDRVGWSVRFDECATTRTRLRFVTDGVLLRRLVTDPLLERVGAVVLDEVHERRLAGDQALGLLRRVRERRPDLRILAMSATLDARPFARFLDAPTQRVEGRRFEVETRHDAIVDTRPLDLRIAESVRAMVDAGLEGDVLVFVPGADEIRRATEALSPLARRANLALRPLHGSLPIEEQERAVRREARRKIVLATNIAETSITIDGVVAVIDSGLARIAGHAAWSGLPTLTLGRISRASATQRAGRAGRIGPGLCVRLYTQHDHDTRPPFDTPEVKRADLSEALLQTIAQGIPLATHRDAPDQFWLDPPPRAAVEVAARLLADLGALDRADEPTEMGRQMLRVPAHPRLARLVVEGARRGALRDATIAAAMLGEGLVPSGEDWSGGRRTVHGSSDVEALVEAFDACERRAFDVDVCRAHGIDARAARRADRARGQLGSVLRAASAASNATDRRTALGLAVLAAYPDRLARRRAPGSRELLTASGGVVRLDERSQVTEPALLVMLDAHTRSDARRSETRVHVASGIEPEWLVELFGDRLESTSTHAFAPNGRRVVRRDVLSLAGVMIEERVAPATPSPEASRVLREAALDAGLSEFCDPTHVEALLARAAFARTQLGDESMPAVEGELATRVLSEICEGRTRFEELREAFDAALRCALGGSRGSGLARLDARAPEFVQLPGGRRARVHYEHDKPPWIASRLQDFFGLPEGPTLADGRLPLVLHLLAPSQRPVQVTTDLAGFWDRHYPAIRRELCRKYPKHAWPEDPRMAGPPIARRR